MAQIQQRFLVVASVLGLSAATAVATSAAEIFLPDDPLRSEPPPLAVGKLEERKLDDIHEFFWMTFGKPGEKSTPEDKRASFIRAKSANTLGNVPDSTWYTNRHGVRRMTKEELLRGPGNENPPAMDGPWQITAAKTEGVTPGFTIKDSKNRRYQIKFDTRLNAELATGADVLGSKFFYALGYFTPENYVVNFRPDQLAIAPDTKFVDYRGVERPMRQADVERVLATIPKRPDGSYRAVASLFLRGRPIGPFRYHGTRTDDPNDIIPHEHRRELRGLRIFAAWLNHTDTKSPNSLDMLVEENGTQYVRHHLIDFSATFGTDAFTPKSPRAGYVHELDWPDATRVFFTLGLYPQWYIRADYPHQKGVGNIESETFDPERWRSHFYNPSFKNCLPDDAYWAAKQVMAFTDEEITALVQTAQYSDQEAVAYLARTLSERRDKIGRTYFTQVLPLDSFRVNAGKLEFEDLAVRYKFSAPRSYSYRWSTFDNKTGRKDPIANISTAALPDNRSDYLAADIWADAESKAVTVYLRRQGGTYEPVAIDRRW